MSVVEYNRSVLDGSANPKDQESILIPWSSFWLCIPCWALAAYAVVLIGTIKLAPHAARSLVSAGVVSIPAILTVVSPFCWVAAFVVAYGRHKRGVHVRLPGWLFIAGSGIAIVSSLIVLECA